MVKRNAIATKLTKRCTQTQKRAFDVAVLGMAVIIVVDINVDVDALADLE